MENPEIALPSETEEQEKYEAIFNWKIEDRKKLKIWENYQKTKKRDNFININLGIEKRYDQAKKNLKVNRKKVNQKT
jgi:hypothetical protein